MRVARIEEFGGPDVLRVAEEPRPEPGDNEILIEVRSAGISRADVLTRGGGYHAAGQPPIVPDAVFPLEGAVDAHRYLEGRRNRGKVVIHPGE